HSPKQILGPTRHAATPLSIHRPSIQRHRHAVLGTPNSLGHEHPPNPGLPVLRRKLGPGRRLCRLHGRRERTLTSPALLVTLNRRTVLHCLALTTTGHLPADQIPTQK